MILGSSASHNTLEVKLICPSADSLSSLHLCCVPSLCFNAPQWVFPQYVISLLSIFSSQADVILRPGATCHNVTPQIYCGLQRQVTLNYH